MTDAMMGTATAGSGLSRSHQRHRRHDADPESALRMRAELDPRQRQAQRPTYRQILVQSGFSLVEMMVAGAIGAILMIGVTDLFIDSKAAYLREQQLARLQESARVAILTLSRDLRDNRSFGCRGAALAEQEGQFVVKVCDLLDSASGYGCGSPYWTTRPHLLGLDRAIGYDNADALASATSYTDLPAVAAGNIADRWLRGDVLVTWGVDEPGAAVTGTLAGAIGTGGGFDGTGALIVDAVPSALGAVGRLALITDCVSADLFAISGPAGLGAGDTRIEHAAIDTRGTNINASDALSHAYNWAPLGNDRHIPRPLHGAKVYPFSYRVFYVCCVDTRDRSIQTGPGVANCRLDPDAAAYDRYRPSLCAWDMEARAGGGSDPLITDVADLRVTYTGDADNDGRIDFSAEDRDTVRSAAWVSSNNAWSGVRSAAVELLLATEQRGVAVDAKAPARGDWPPGGGDGIPADTLGAGLPADGRLYHRFVINVAMRSRTPWYIGPER